MSFLLLEASSKSSRHNKALLRVQSSKTSELKQIALEFKIKIQSLDMAQQSCSRQNNQTTSGFGKVAISVRHTYLDQVWRWRNWSCTTYWSHHSSIRHNMHLLCPQCLLLPRQTGRSVHQVIEVFALLQFCNPTILQTCYAATVLQHIVTVYVLLQLIVRFQHVGIFPQYNNVAKKYVMHAPMCDFGCCRPVCRGKC